MLLGIDVKGGCSKPQCSMVESCMVNLNIKYPPGNDHISNLGKRKIIFKSKLVHVGDMLVAKTVSNKCFNLWAWAGSSYHNIWFWMLNTNQLVPNMLHQQYWSGEFLNEHLCFWTRFVVDALCTLHLALVNTPRKINMEPSNHPFRKENDLPNLPDYVPC